MNGKYIYSCFPVILIALGIAAAQQTQPSTPETQQPSAPASKAETAKKPEHKRLVVNLAGFEMLDPSKMHRERHAVGATRGFPQPQALAPYLGKLYGASALFAWSYPGKARDFILRITDEKEAEVFHAEVSGTAYRLPETAPRLEPDKSYSWTVEVTPALFGTNPSEPVEFVEVSQAERREIEKSLKKIKGRDPYQAGLARAKVFTDHRLWYDAIGAYTELISRYPERAEPYEQRGTIYAQIDATEPLAEQDFARADELEMKQPQN
jgi:hypothetical protein